MDFISRSDQTGAAGARPAPTLSCAPDISPRRVCWIRAHGKRARPPSCQAPWTQLRRNLRVQARTARNTLCLPL